MSWEPILDGELADRAWAAVREIADDIAAVPDAQPEELALFWAYAAAGFGDEASEARFERATEALFDHVERELPGRALALFGGLTGIGWTFAHAGGGEDLLPVIDRLLADALSSPWTGDHDLIIGLAGYAVYLAERARAAAVDGAALELLVERLDELAEHSPAGTTWFTPPHLLRPWQRERWPDGYYNLGVAHGVPGIAAALARIASLDAAPPRAAELCAGAVRWLAAQSFPAEPTGRYPLFFTRTGEAYRVARAGWCYGDPGLAVAMWSAAAQVGLAIEPWRDLALDCARRPAELCGIADAGLCHGAFGLAHLFNRCYQASREPAFREAARRWFERGLARRRPGEGIGGFVVLAQDSEQVEFVASARFLDGAAGIGLALLAALHAEEPRWDRRLLCDLPVA